MTLSVMDCYFSEEKVASDLRVNILTLRNWAVKRKGPPRVNIARKIYYPKDGMTHWLLSQEPNEGADT